MPRRSSRSVKPRKGRRTSRRLARSKRRLHKRLARSKRTQKRQRGGMAESVMSPEGIPIALQGANTETTVIKKVGDVPTVMSYNTYAKHYKGRDESDFN